MKLSRLCALGLLSVVGAMGGGYKEVKAEEPQGYIIFSQQPEGAGRTCSVPIRTGTTLMSDTDCKNDVVSYFQLNNVPSAVVFSLNSESTCSSSGDWYFTMRTIVHPITTIWLSIPSLKTRPNGEIIVKGLRMENNHYDHGNIEGKLSCVQITRSN